MGQGAGNYDDLYFVERRTNEDIRQPHSLEMQTLAELGLVGMLVPPAVRRRGASPACGGSRAGRWSCLERRMVAVAAGGAFVAWLDPHERRLAAQHPRCDRNGALCRGCARVAVGAAEEPRPAVRADRRRGARRGVRGRWQRTPWAGSRIAEKDRIDARDALQVGPGGGAAAREPLAGATTTSRCPRFTSRGLRTPGSAATGSRATSCARPLDLEPRDHLTWALLGDLSARRGKYRQAKAYYQRSLALNPKNEFVRALVKNPRQ